MKKFLVFLCAMVVLNISSHALAVQYMITDLGDLGPYQPWAINDSGQVIGQTVVDSESVGFLWENGTMSILKTADETIYEPYDINNSGTIVGQGRAYDGNNLGQAYLWEDGIMTHLGSVDPDLPIGVALTHDAWGINEHGQIVGGTTGAHHDFFLWENDAMTDLGQGFAYGINNLGSIVGGRRGSQRDHAFLWKNGVFTDLGLGDARAINDSGKIVGTDDNNAIIWNNGTEINLGPGTAFGINNLGQVVGVLNGNAFIWENGTLTDLNTLIPINSGWILERATDINELGQIVGRGIMYGENHGFLLTPIPEPTTILLLGTGLIVLVGFRRKFKK